ncbi:MAG: UDP-glucose 4-epimerase GalE [Candidatus Cryptobacteroides sp.]
MRKKTVLVSGGAGYIGSHVTVELINAGYDVVVADNMSNCDKTCFEGVKKITDRDDIPFELLDCCDTAGVQALFGRYKIDAVIHFAAFKAVGESVAEPIKYYRNNLDSFLNILDAAIAHGGCNVLFSSSATVYGETDQLPVTEESPRQSATSPYGNTKQICEDILRDVIKASAAYGTEVNAGASAQGPVKGIALRYFNPIGAHPSALIGELPRGVPNNLVPFITQTAIGKRACLSIFGNDYPTPDGTCLRDYIDIVDLAKAHVAAVSRMVDGKMKADYEIFNVGTGRPVSVSELVNAFEKVNGLKLNYKYVDRRPGDVVAIWADTSLANEELGWKAERTVEETLASAWAWEKHIAGIE